MQPALRYGEAGGLQSLGAAPGLDNAPVICPVSLIRAGHGLGRVPCAGLQGTGADPECRTHGESSSAAPWQGLA